MSSGVMTAELDMFKCSNFEKARGGKVVITCFLILYRGSGKYKGESEKKKKKKHMLGRTLK